MVVTIERIAGFWYAVVKPYKSSNTKEAYAWLENSFLLALTFESRIDPERKRWEDLPLLFADQTLSRKTEDASTRISVAWEILRLIISSSNGQTVLLGRGYYTCQRYWRNRKVFITRKGCLGLGPSTMLPGDILAVFSGIGNPAIIRKNNGSHEFVGMAYVPSISNGEAVVEWKEVGAQLESFELK